MSPKRSQSDPDYSPGAGSLLMILARPIQRSEQTKTVLLPPIQGGLGAVLQAEVSQRTAVSVKLTGQCKVVAMIDSILRTSADRPGERGRGGVGEVEDEEGNDVRRSVWS